MSLKVINISVAVLIAISFFSVVMGVYLGSDTTGWSTTQITVMTAVTLALLVAVIVSIFKASQ